jgi:RimJ/RimL family protein N-acetyltransferase
MSAAYASRNEPDDVGLPAFARSFVGAGCDAGTWATPLLAIAWARAIGSQWSAGRRMGHFDPRAPMPVLDLAPGDGRFGAMLLHALRDGCEELGLPPKGVRYIACLPEGADIAHWKEASGLAGDASFEAVAWDPSTAEAHPFPVCRGYAPQGRGNAVAVVAQGYLQQFPGELRGVHEGQWLEGRVSALATKDDGSEVEYLWRPSHDGDDAPLLRDRYLRVLGSACVTLPVAGLRALRRIAAMSGGRFLWLAADRGVDTEERIRLGELTPPEWWTADSPSLPVNFHALSFEQTRHGAWSHHRRLGRDGAIVQAIWRHDGVSHDEKDYERLARHLDGGHPDDVGVAAYLARALDADASPSLHLSLLRLSGHAPEVLAPALEAWSETPPVLEDVEREAWCSALDAVWAGTAHAPAWKAFRHGLAMLATHWRRFALARAVFAVDRDRHGLAICDAATGYPARALAHLDYGSAIHVQVSARLDRWRGLDWYRAALARDDDLAIEPLGIEHAEELFGQYRDPQIGVLTRLPEFASVEAVGEWIVTQARQPGRMSYAVQQETRGFVGVVSLHVAGDAGYFYFWTGCDHQGKGYGRRAGRLLCAQARACGVRRLFTSVYPANWRSREALGTMDFVELGVRATAPDDDLVFLVADGADDADQASNEARLALLLCAIGSPIHLVGAAALVEIEDGVHG